MKRESLLEPDLDDAEFVRALQFRYVDDRYFAQRDAADAGNQLAASAFDLLESEQWEQAWEITRTDIARACLSAPLASPFNNVIGNRINFLFISIFSLTRLIRDNFISEMDKPWYILRLIEVLERALVLDYRQYVKWGVSTASRFENLRDAAELLANHNPLDDVFDLPSSKNRHWVDIKSIASKLSAQMDDVLAMEEVHHK